MLRWIRLSKQPGNRHKAQGKALGIRHEVKGTRHEVKGTRHEVKGTRHEAEEICLTKIKQGAKLDKTNLLPVLF